MFGSRTKVVLLSSVALLGLQYSSAWAQTKASDETVIVTGTRGKERTVTSSATPIDVLKGAAIEQAGQGSVLAALDTLIPSFIEPAIPGGSTATVIHTGGMRGLSPDQTLILINGKRRHRTALNKTTTTQKNRTEPND